MKATFLRGQSAPITVNLGLKHFLVSFVFLITIIFLLQYVLLKNSNDSSIEIKKLLQRLTVLEAQTQRLNMLGLHLAKQTYVDIAAFNLTQNPALGGITGSSVEPESEIMSEQRLLASIKKSEEFLMNQKSRLDSFQARSINNIQNGYSRQFHAYQNPVQKGYVSSRFGMRNDPINGKHRLHKGVDIAGKKGTPISTIASGFVTFAGRKGGYGNVVEIHHSDSLKSRYAHLDTILVKKGGVVRKGRRIATMGSTGRVTGPHLHLEVWEDGKAVNPEKYLKRVLGGFSLK